MAELKDSIKELPGFFVAVMILFLAPLTAFHGQTPSVWSKSERNVAEREFFAFVAMQDSPEILHALSNDPALAAMRTKRDAAIQTAASTCHDAPCFVGAFRWSDDEISTAGTALQELTKTDPAFRRFVDTKLRASGRFALYDEEPAADLIVSAWKDGAHAMNRILSVYGEGVPPLYERIDAMRYDPKSGEFVEFLQASASMIVNNSVSMPLFFSATMKYAILLMEANGRMDAGRFEPLASAENKPAIERVPTIDWKRYPYAVIVVPGEGPEQADVALSPLGRVRVEQAAALYRSGKAPFILVSGGTVHPMLTRFDEAVEMRRQLEEQWNVPASAILIDPYARHTTTNLRNAAREVIRYHLPQDKPMLISSDAGQIRLIMSSAFAARCLREMHLLPWRTLTQLAPTEAVMLSNKQSMQEDSIDDPLDP
jgi:hypothetical protein